MREILFRGKDKFDGEWYVGSLTHDTEYGNCTNDNPDCWRVDEKVQDKKYIQVVNCQPAANKKGLRIKVEAVELDKENNLVAMYIDYSGFHVRGRRIIEISQRNKKQLPGE